jgi:predicted TPR repeat methyltransferase
MSSENLRLVNDFAPGYDKYIKNCNWNGPDMLFGMMYEYLSPDQKVLDLGIGTGLSAALFGKAGLEVYGLDGSEVMLQICKEKNIAKKLIKADLSEGKIPTNIVFNHMVSFAVFHFLADLQPLFKEINLHLSENGTFGFSIDIYNSDRDTEYKETSVPSVFVKEQESGPTIYKHTEQYLENTLRAAGFDLKKSSEIQAFADKENNREVWFQLLVVQKSRVSA